MKKLSVPCKNGFFLFACQIQKFTRKYSATWEIHFLLVDGVVRLTVPFMAVSGARFNFISATNYFCLFAARSEVKLVRKIVIDQNEICEDDYRYRNKYDRIFHVCVNSSAAPCEYDSPIMAIDTSSPDNRYWYLFGVFTYGPPHCNSFPKINTQVFPELKWILRMIRL